MSPDSQQPQTPPTLPEVPQITPPQPVSPTNGPVMDPLPAQPSVQPASAPVPEPAPAVVPTPQPFPQPAPAPSQFAQSTTFPAQAPVPPQTIPSATPQPAPKKKLGLLIGVIAGGLVVVGALVAVLLIFVLPSGKINESDLVSATTDSTTYLRPKQWQSITVSSISGYGDKKGKDGTSTALIAVQKKNYVQSGVTSASASQLDTFRETVKTSMTSGDAEDAIKETGSSCTSTEDVTVTKSSVSTTNMVGVLRVDGICVRSDGRFKIVLYITLGEDGYLRSIALMSTESQWKLNEAVFNKMLESADQE